MEDAFSDGLPGLFRHFQLSHHDLGRHMTSLAFYDCQMNVIALLLTKHEIASEKAEVRPAIVMLL